MRLGEFILENMEPILLEWEQFARVVQPDSGDLDTTELRDHAEEMLGKIAAELIKAEEEERQLESDEPRLGGETSAGRHAEDRLNAGFPIDVMVSEYRALRATVLKLWLQEDGHGHLGEVDDLIRFNEAIDQTLAESVTCYAEAIVSAQDVFLSILGHDLRAPLQSLGSGAEFLMQGADPDGTRTRLGSRMYRSVKRMSAMLDNLADFTRTRVGGDLAIRPEAVDLAEISEQVIEEQLSCHDDRTITNQVRGDCTGHWDPVRIARVYQNLIGNALEHGAQDTPVTVRTTGEPDQVVLRVHNEGPPIPENDHEQIFDLLHRRADGGVRHDNHLGLGLYIAREIVNAHGGTISVSSSAEQGTTFVVELPRGTG